MGDIGIAGLRPPGGDWRDVLEMAALVDGLGYSCITTGEAWGRTLSRPSRRLQQ